MMEYVKFNSLYEENKNLLQLKYKSDDVVEYQVKMINFNKELPIVAMDMFSINDVSTLNYDITGYDTLFNIINKKAINAKELLDVAVTLFSNLMNLNNYFLKSNNVYLNDQYVYYNPFTKKVKIIYLPLKEELRDNYTKQKIYLLNLLLNCKKMGFNNEYLDKAIMELRDDIGNFRVIKEKLEKATENDIAIEDPKESFVSTPLEEKKSFWQKISIKERPKKNVVKERLQHCEASFDESKYLDCFTLVIYDENNPRLIPLNREVLLLGRFEGAVDIPIRNSSVGRIHGRIEKAGDNYFYIDLGSKNGSFINGKRAISNKRYTLKNDTKLKVGSVNMIIQSNRSK